MNALLAYLSLLSPAVNGWASKQMGWRKLPIALIQPVFVNKLMGQDTSSRPSSEKRLGVDFHLRLPFAPLHPAVDRQLGYGRIGKAIPKYSGISPHLIITCHCHCPDKPKKMPAHSVAAITNIRPNRGSKERE